jgi:hypothetical protein
MKRVLYLLFTESKSKGDWEGTFYHRIKGDIKFFFLNNGKKLCEFSKPAKVKTFKWQLINVAILIGKRK